VGGSPPGEDGVPETVLILFVGLELKHYIADYLLQPRWLLAGKGNLLSPGGYVHAGIHVAGSLLVLLLVGLPPGVLATILAAEFVLHYAIDFIKYRYGKADAHAAPWRFWALHGLDQLCHQLTYVGMVYAALRALA